MLAEGVAEAQAVNAGFLSDTEAATFWAEGIPEGDEQDLTYPGGDGTPRAARLYKGGSAGTLLYIHGGGWTGGSIALNHRACRLLARTSGWDVVSIAYRLAPGHPFPAGLDDCRAALRWLRPQAGRIAIGGASAGGNLALATALADGADALLLFYPVTGADFDTDSYRQYAEGFGLTRARMAELFDLYDPTGTHRADPLLTPLNSDLTGLPTTHIIAAECDVLADDSRALAAKMPQASLHIEPGVTHGFINRGRLIPAADRCLSQAAHFLRDLP